MPAEARLQEALAFHQRGQRAEARRLYEAILAGQPDFFDALHLLGILDLEDRAPARALAWFDQAIALRPDHPQAHSNRGNALFHLDRLVEALASYDRALALAPGYVDALYNRGNVLYATGRRADAVASYDRVIALQPGHAEAHSNRGVALFELGRFDEAVASYDKAIALRPAQAALHANRANALRQLRRLPEAVAGYDRAIALRSDATVLCSRGHALYEMGHLEDAIASYDQALALAADHAEAWSRRGFALRDLGRLEAAVESYRKALALDPDADFLFGEYLHTRMQACDWATHDGDVADLAARIAAGRRASSPFIALAILDDPVLHRRASESYSAARYGVVESARPFVRREKSGRIRVGYYSADFHDHATAYLIAELIETHDRSRFDCIAFSFGPDRRDAMRQRLASGFDRFVDVGARSDREIVDLSRELGIDIAIDLKGFTRDSRPAIFAGRCAPVQASYLGYPGTMGARHMDYIIADSVVIPEASRRHYSEKVVWLPGSYQPNDSSKRMSARSPSRRELGLGEGFVFCCFNNSYKVQPATFDSWMRILTRVDGSRLWLIEDNAAAVRNLRSEAAARGVDGDRLVFSRRIPLGEHLARHQCADLFLDTLPYNAHTTASDALWAGLPVLTLTGKAFAGRVATSLLRAIGMPDLVTETARVYEQRAVDLATVPGALAAIKRKLAANRQSSALFDGTAFARHLEGAYSIMYDRYRQGLAPGHIEIAGAL
ncbi:tetratricopeptide repeat protein [Reyranella sp.]|uniref:tetratricopeptide repeat protein n=1 Tax=Reyranella sp. TaxID=1929291 RepID=UPI003783A0A8